VSQSRAIGPGAVLGVLGGGQLGRMFTIAARQMGYRIHSYSPDEDTPAGQVADVEVTASYEDLDALRAFAGGVDAVTFEFENVPIEAIDAVEELAPVRPSGPNVTNNPRRGDDYSRSSLDTFTAPDSRMIYILTIFAICS
jgi:5-(carboxyamino)imidazole ribonucleotide synthase